MPRLPVHHVEMKLRWVLDPEDNIIQGALYTREEMESLGGDLTKKALEWFEGGGSVKNPELYIPLMTIALRKYILEVFNGEWNLDKHISGQVGETRLFPDPIDPFKQAEIDKVPPDNRHLIEIDVAGEIKSSSLWDSADRKSVKCTSKQAVAVILGSDQAKAFFPESFTDKDLQEAQKGAVEHGGMKLLQTSGVFDSADIRISKL